MHSPSAIPLDRAESLLLAVALAEPAQARKAWQQWSADARLDAISPGAFRILPAVARRLQALAIDPDDAGRIRGAYRYAWAQYQVTTRTLGLAIEALAATRVPVVCHRGIPAVARILGDPASIIVDQVDFLIRITDVDTVLGALARAGWRSCTRVPTGLARPAFAAVALESAVHRRVVLHWRALPLGGARWAEHAIIDRATVEQVGPHRILIPDATDQALIDLARGDQLLRHEWPAWALLLGRLMQQAVSEEDLAARAAAAGLPAQALARLGAVLWLAGTEPPGHPAPAPDLLTVDMPATRSTPLVVRAWLALRRTWRIFQVVRRAEEWGGSILRFPRFLVEYQQQVWSSGRAVDPQDKARARPSVGTDAELETPTSLGRARS